MIDLRTLAAKRARAWLRRATELRRSRRMRRVAVALAALFVLYGVAGYFGGPVVVRRVVTGPVAAALHRPVTVGKISFHPYRLGVELDHLRIGARGAPGRFVDIASLRARVSWTSLLRLAPVIKEVTVVRPSIRIVRTAAERFNFSDLLESKPTAAAAPKPAPAATRFAVSNIRVIDGAVQYDDQFLGAKHTIEHIQIGVPFVANFPADVDVFVQPLLEMVVDGSPLRIAGKAKPFATPPQSVLNLKLHRLDLARYLAYLPASIPIRIPAGTLSCALHLHFINTPGRPQISVRGAVALDNLEVRDSANSPVMSLRHAVATLRNLEPLGSVAHIAEVYVDDLALNVVRNPDGRTNLAMLAGGNAGAKRLPAPAKPAATQTPATAPARVPASARPRFDFSLKALKITDSTVRFTDNAGDGAQPAVLALESIGVTLSNLDNRPQAQPAPFSFGATLGGGGALKVNGTVDLVHSRAVTEIAIDQLDLPAFNEFAQPYLAGAIASGKLTANAKAQTDFGSAFDVHAGPASFSLDNFAIRATSGREEPIAWKSFATSLAELDLAKREANVTAVRLEGLHLIAQRRADGRLSLESLIRKPKASAEKLSAKKETAEARRIGESRRRTPAASTPEPPPWHFRVASVAVENAGADLQDRSTPRPVTLALSNLNLHLRDMSDDLSKPIAVELDGKLNRTGMFKFTGSATPAPLNADLRIAIGRLDLAFLDPYLSSRLNASIRSAELGVDGAAKIARAGGAFATSFHGNARLDNVRVLDKLTKAMFVRWKKFAAGDIDLATGAGPPRMQVGKLDLSNFYARIILNADGKMNLKDVMATPHAPPKSLTQPEVTSTPAPAAKAPPARPIAADIGIGAIALDGGRINYTDNFVKPNFTANLTDLTAKVGAFGTRSTAPASVWAEGQVNGSAPLNIFGSVNPLAPMASVDLTARVKGLEMTNLTPYSAKYTGYPIVKGTLSVDLHYLLDHDKLSAQNHIFIDQFTFGDRVESRDATNLPVRLAVALLKNSRGEINLDIPVSGSLSDPKFSVGGVILQTLINLIAKAATSPFTLIAAATGLGGSAAENLGEVDFQPGWATLAPASRTQLDTVAALLKKRPSLKLNISGRVDPKVDRDGLREAIVTRSIRREKIKDLGRRAENLDPSAITMTPAEYDKYLARAYAAAKFKKPTNFLGLSKSLPPAEMKKLMLENTKVTDADLRGLADARAAAVRKFLSTRIDPERLFIVAPKLDASGIKPGGTTTRADLTLQ
jgi:Domain of Unknown Function (DUF748)